MPASGETVENTGGTASGHREGPPAPAAAPSWKFQLLCMRLDNVRHGYVLQCHSICMVTFPYFDLRISQGTCFGIVLDCFWIVSGWVLLIGEVDRFHARSRDAMMVA